MALTHFSGPVQSDAGFLDGSGNAVGGGLALATHSFTQAELEDMDVTPVEIIPSPGSGFAIIPVQVFTTAIGGAVSYDEGNMGFHYGDAGGQSIVGGQNYPQSGDALFDMTVQTSLSSLAISDQEDKAIVATNDGNDPSVGDGTMSVAILYYVVAV